MGGTRKKHLAALMTEKPECRYCGRPVDATTATLDHVVAVSRGGTNSLTNLVLSCKECNGHKGNMGVCVWAEIVSLMQKENFYAKTKDQQKTWMAEVVKRTDAPIASRRSENVTPLWDATQYLWGVALGRNKSTAKHWRFPGCPKGLSPGRRKELLKEIVFKKQGGCYGCKSTFFSMKKSRFSLPDKVLYLLCETCHPRADPDIAVMTAPPQQWLKLGRG